MRMFVVDAGIREHINISSPTRSLNERNDQTSIVITLGHSASKALRHLASAALSYDDTAQHHPKRIVLSPA
jgi:hypothetical protein